MPDVLSLLFAGGAIASGVLVQRGRKRRRALLVRAIAERRHGVYDGGGWFGEPHVELTYADGIELHVTVWESKSGRYTEYLALVPPPGLPVASASPTGVVAGITRALGAQAIEVGIGSVDDAFVCKGEDAVLVRQMMRHPAMQRVLLAEPRAKLESHAGQLRLTRPRLDTLVDAEATIDAVLAVARSDPYGIAALDALPEARIRHDERFSWVEVPGPSVIGVGPRYRDRLRVRTCAWTEALGVVPDAPETLVTPSGGTLEIAEGELRIWWDGIETEARRLGAAIEALRRLTSGPAHGVFR